MDTAVKVGAFLKRGNRIITPQYGDSTILLIENNSLFCLNPASDPNHEKQTFFSILSYRPVLTFESFSPVSADLFPQFVPHRLAKTS
jgi:hypothetical protein